MTLGERWRRRVTAPLLVLLAAACASRGPGRVPADRFDYNEAIASSRKEQMLLNLVRMRYGDVPLFLSVSSVLTQYTYSGQLSAGGTVAVGGADRFGATQDSVGAAGAVEYVERPTVTYAPLTGEAFSRRLISPLSNEMIFSLSSAGAPTETLIPIALHRINDIESLSNKLDYDASDVVGFERFSRMAALVSSLRNEGILEVRKSDDGPDRRLMFELAQSEQVQRQVDELKELLGLPADKSVFRVVTRTIGRRDDEITIQPRSLVSIMAFLSRGIEVPSEHAAAGHVLEGVEHEGMRLPLRVRVSVDAPDSAHVAARYRDHWFYIPHTDLASKRAFSLLLYLFEVQAPSGDGKAPLLTLPT